MSVLPGEQLKSDPFCFEPGSVWSLWKIMLKLNAGQYSVIVRLMLALEDRIGETYNIGPREVVEAHPLSKDILDVIQQFSDVFVAYCDEVGISVTKALSEDLRNVKTVGEFNTSYAQIRRVHEVELRDVHFLVLKKNAAGLYESLEPFGATVTAKFPAVVEDLEFASKCIAVEQPTASVFHLMRAMESIVGALCTHLSIPNPERVWGILLSDMDKEIEKMPKGKKRNDWSEARSNLYHVKQAWRNETMHPKQTYTLEQASEVFNAMRAFSVHLADLLD